MMQNELHHEAPVEEAMVLVDDTAGASILDDKGAVQAGYREASNDDLVESLSTRFNDEIEAWARRALLSNGFGDW